MNKDEPMLEQMWPLGFVFAFLCVVAGCPHARHARVVQTQDMAEWQVEHIQNFRVSATNGTFMIEMGGEK